MLSSPRSLRADATMLALLWVMALVLLARTGAVAAEATRALQLEVFINNTPTQKIGAFVDLGQGRLAAAAQELAELGVKIEGPFSGQTLVALDELPGLSYRFDEPAQSVHLTLGHRQLVARQYDARGALDAPTPQSPDLGGVLNYTVFASSLTTFPSSAPTFSGANAALDGRLFGPFGTFGQSAILGMTPASQATSLRLETFWRNSDPQSLITTRVGDTISGGLAWTRPIRMAGVQVQRNFALRPDLVTLPLPSLSGSAAVPSTVEVFINNAKTHTQELAPGPYEIRNLPVPTEAGTARVVIRDATGQQTVTNLPFLTSPKLLRPGLMDFSVEAGVPRLRYGLESDEYATNAVASLSLRGGIHDHLTLEGHAEAGAGLALVGLGAVLGMGPFGLASLALSGSHRDDETGVRSYLAYQTRLGSLHLRASFEHTFGRYNDLASATARYPTPTFADQGVLGSQRVSSFLLGAKPPTSLTTVSLGAPLPFDKAWLNGSYLSLEQVDGTRVDLLSISYSRPLFGGASLNANAYCDLQDQRSRGAMISISIPLGDSISASASAFNTGTSSNVVAEASKSLRQEPGSFGWRLRDYEGSNPSRFAEGAYRSSIGEWRGGVLQMPSGASGYVQASGAVASLGGNVFLSNRIDDAFAVVKAGAPNVDVLYENRPIGRTNADGALLVPNLRSYQANKIGIDPQALPLDAAAPTTLKIAAPADGSGVVVDFGVRSEQGAVVILVDRAGQFIPAGSPGRLETADTGFTVGYDGRAYIRHLGAHNSVLVTTATGSCRSSFAFAAAANQQVVIGPVACQ